MMIQKTSEFISNAVYRNIDIDEHTLEINIIERRISVLLIYIYLALTLLLVGLIFDNIWQILIATIGLIVVRSIGGGNHFNSADMCYFVTTSIIIMSPFLCYVMPKEYDIYVLLTCMILYVVYAPHDWKFKRGYWIKKIVMVLLLITSFLLAREFLYISFIMIADQIIGNQRYKK